MNKEHFVVTYVGKDGEGVKRRWYLQKHPDDQEHNIWTLNLQEALHFPIRKNAVIAVLCLGIGHPKAVFKELDVCPIKRGAWETVEHLYSP